MSLIKIAAVAAAAMALGAAAVPAQASLFTYSYEFDDGVSVSGSFTGNQSGLYVTDVTNVVLTINGNDAGPVQLFGYYGEAFYSIAFDRSLNNFWFTDDHDSWTVGFALVGSAVTTPEALANGNDFEYVFDLANGVPETPFPGTPMNDSWLLVAVPEPATLALLGLGLAGFGMLRRRR